jgi:hypothetical protein
MKRSWFSLPFLLTALLFSVSHVQAQFGIGAPAAGATLVVGQNFTVQIIVPIDTSAEAGAPEVGLAIGIVSCSTSSGCPAPSADLGQLLFAGKFQGQGTLGNSLNQYENFTFVVPDYIPTGPSAIQVMHVYLLTPPVRQRPLHKTPC